MDSRIILDVRLPVIAGATEARLFHDSTPVNRHGAFATLFGEFGVGRGKAVAIGALAIVAIR